MKNLYLLSFLLFFFLSCRNGVRKEKEKHNLFYDRAFECRETNNPDSAFLYFNKAKDLFLQQKDSLGVGKCLVNMAIISTDRGDYFGGQELSLNSLSYFNQKKEENYGYLESNYNNLGIATYKLEDYKHALKFYDIAIKFSKDSKHIRLYLNNKAKSYQELKQYTKALKIYYQILEESIKNRKDYARTLTNISYTKWLQNPTYNAIPDYLKALNIREEEGDLEGKNSSYSHLSDYYAKKQSDSAFFYASKMYQAAKHIDNPDNQLEVLLKLIRVGPLNEIKQYFEIYQKKTDSLQAVRNLAKNKFAIIRYEVEKNKLDNLKLQKDNTEKKYQIIKQKALLFIALLVLVGGSIISAIWIRKRKQKMESQSRDAIRENQLKTSRKVHDVVANGLYRIMIEIENQDDIPKDHLLDKIEDMYEKSRDISYEELQFKDQNFQETVSDLITSFATERTQVLFVGNTEDLWKKVNAEVKYEVEHILQELMVNMKKHSQASNVTFRFEQKDNKINIYYTDNGIGIPEKLQFKNGLTNTGNRIDSIRGAIIFDTKAEKGLKVQISFPFS